MNLWYTTVLTAVDEQLRRLMRKRERYVKAWIAATGFHPTDCELVETVRTTATGIETVVSIRRRQS